MTSRASTVAVLVAAAALAVYVVGPESTVCRLSVVLPTQLSHVFGCGTGAVPGARTALFFAGGSRGDTQPVLALALEMKKQGWKTHFVTGPDSMDFVAPLLEKDEIEIMKLSWREALSRKTIQDAAIADDANALVTGIAGIMIEIFENGDLELMERAIARVKPDVVIGSTACWQAGAVLAEVHRIPAVGLLFQPCQVNSDYAPPMIDAEALGIPKEAFVGLWEAMFGMFHNSSGPYLGAIRAKHGLPPPSVEELIDVVHGKESIFMLLSFSRILYPDPTEDPKYPLGPNRKVVNELVVRESKRGNTKVSEEVRRFVEAPGRDAPLYIGWGSMNFQAINANVTKMVVEALKRTGKRAVILSGWAELSMAHVADDPELQAYAADNTLFVDGTNHDWLFPRCQAVLVHCGAGTTAAVLRGGVPVLGSPFIFDQTVFARMLANDLGMGKRINGPYKLTADELAEAIVEVTTNPAFSAAAKAVRERVLAEGDAAVEAVEAIEDFLARSS